ncbi:hypothetical protein [Flavivirga eckloniae]|uniref:Uncharacterized protein n=1 Tax=Flavivirga eckloniae TaxID=1803846 RepID=A0A2K9PTW4_9FLAO|nr:hypothetical protein [Flavivirga eckloniae]AUP80502.1 hypothetical protein C1H87_18005 [Flavivirga eckloniae]
MDNISMFTSSAFVLTTLASVWLFYKASNNKKALYGIIVWMVVVGGLGILGFYQKLDTVPPRFTLLLGPVLIFVILLFTNKRSRRFIDGLNLKWLTILHIVRIPVEIVLYYVFIAGLIPDLMTFSGYNFDIISGITAPVIYYIMFVKKTLNRKALLIWNVLCLGLLINILTIAVLSAQTPFQQLAFEQPNIGVTYFPFVWLPTVIVPIVFLSHLASIRRLTSR